MSSPEIPTHIKALLDEQHLLPALWYVGPLQAGGPRHSDGPSKPIEPLPLIPAPATAPPDTTPAVPAGTLADAS